MPESFSYDRVKLTLKDCDAKLRYKLPGVNKVYNNPIDITIHNFKLKISKNVNGETEELFCQIVDKNYFDFDDEPYRVSIFRRERRHRAVWYHHGRNYVLKFTNNDNFNQFRETVGKLSNSDSKLSPPTSTLDDDSKNSESPKRTMMAAGNQVHLGLDNLLGNLQRLHNDMYEAIQSLRVMISDRRLNEIRSTQKG